MPHLAVLSLYSQWYLKMREPIHAVLQLWWQVFKEDSLVIVTRESIEDKAEGDCKQARLLLSWPAQTPIT